MGLFKKCCCSCCTDGTKNTCSGSSDTVSDLAFSVGGMHATSFTEKLRSKDSCTDGTFSTACNDGTRDYTEYPETGQSLPLSLKSNCCMAAYVAVPTTKGRSTPVAVERHNYQSTSWDVTTSGTKMCLGSPVSWDKRRFGQIASEWYRSLNAIRAIDAIKFKLCAVTVSGVPKYQLDVTVYYRVILNAATRKRFEGENRTERNDIIDPDDFATCTTSNHKYCCTANVTSGNFGSATEVTSFTDSVCEVAHADVDTSPVATATGVCSNSSPTTVEYYTQTRSIIIDRNCALAGTYTLHYSDLVGSLTEFNIGLPVLPTLYGFFSGGVYRISTCIDDGGVSPPSYVCGAVTGTNTAVNVYEAMTEDWVITLS